MEYPDTFGAIVRRRREALRLSRGALADLVACSEETIKKIERDERRPSPEVAALLAKHLLISAAEREEFQLMARGLRNSRSVGSSYPPLPFMRQPLSTRSNVFVARERELAYLHTQLDHALAHEGRVVL
jgi:transcriptional regulator with XRE-family HTH domain